MKADAAPAAPGDGAEGGGAAVAPRRLTSFWVKLGISALLLGVQAWRSDLGALRRTLAVVEPDWFAGAVLLFVASHVLSVYRWILLARPLGFSEPAGSFFTYYFAGVFMNLFAPSTLAGDVGRGLFLAGGRRRLAALSTVVAQRLIGLLAMAWIAAVAVHTRAVAEFPRTLVVLVTVFAPLATAAAWWGPRLAVRLLPREHALRRAVEGELRPLWDDHRQVLLSALTAFVYHLLQIGSQIFTARALAVALPAGFFFAFVPLVNVAIMMPLSLSGVGVREAGVGYFLRRAGVDRDTALAIGLLGSAIAVGACLLGAPAFLRGRPAPAKRG